MGFMPSRSFIAFLVLGLLAFIIVSVPTRAAQKPGDIAKGNVVINSAELIKTSEVIVIPQHKKAVIHFRDDTSWNSIVSESASDDWRGVFTKGRKVTLSSFCMAQYPVTQELYTAIMGFNPCYFKRENLYVKYHYHCIDENPDIRPADTISWFDAVVFCNLLTTQIMKESDCAYYADTAYTKPYTREDAAHYTLPHYNASKKGYRLPTEAEWEFAARGGNMHDVSWSYAFSGTHSVNAQLVYNSRQHVFIDANLHNHGWYKGNSNGVTHEVGLKQPNSLHLYDMSGNIWEWLYDWYEYTIPKEKVLNPYGAKQGTDRVLRGGSWTDEAYESCVTRRFRNAHPYIPHYFFGFRYCRSL